MSFKIKTFVSAIKNKKNRKNCIPSTRNTEYGTGTISKNQKGAFDRHTFSRHLYSFISLSEAVEALRAVKGEEIHTVEAHVEIMSKFWAAAGSSSESESGSESESEDEQQTQRQAGGKFGSTFQESDSGEYNMRH